MKTKIALFKNQFTTEPKILLKNKQFTVTLFKYHSDIEALKLENKYGFIIVLPYMGQMIWDVEFLGKTLKMGSPFSEPRKGSNIIDTYGCFAFHSGLKRNGCPSEEDDHPLHGEMPCAPMDETWLFLEQDQITLVSGVEYIKGFGEHYYAEPSVCLKAESTVFTIHMEVKNLSYFPMPLQYMCHINYAYIANGTFSQNIPQEAFKLRETVPLHVHPTPQWLEFNQQIQTNPSGIAILNQPQFYDPEIVFFADHLSQYTEQAEFFLNLPDGGCYTTQFSTQEFNHATRWILYNGDMQVSAFVLPATCRPEGFLAAKKSNSLIMLSPKESRQFNVTTGLIL